MSYPTNLLMSRVCVFSSNTITAIASSSGNASAGLGDSANMEGL